MLYTNSISNHCIKYLQIYVIPSTPFHKANPS